MSVIYRLKTLSFRKKFTIVAAVFLLFGLVGGVIISQQQQEIRSRAAGDINGNHPGDLVGDDFRVAGTVLGNIIGNRNQVSNGVQGGIYGSANSINGNVGGCINGDNNRVAGNVAGGVVGTNNIVSGTKGTGDCPLPGTVTSAPTAALTPTPTKTPTIAPTAIPTPTPTRIPTVTPTSIPPTPTPTRLPTPTPTRVPTPTPTVTIGDTALSLNLLLHGIGKGGDSANPNGGGNSNPNRPQRMVTVEVYNSQNQLVLTRQGSVSFNQSAGNFTGTVGLGNSIPAGSYTVKVKTSQYLRVLVPGIQDLSPGTKLLPVATMIVGDINSDNTLNILDYNILMGCYSDFEPPASCTPANEILTDLDDDTATNQFDYNLFLRELTNRQGE